MQSIIRRELNPPQYHSQSNRAIIHSEPSPMLSRSKSSPICSTENLPAHLSFAQSITLNGASILNTSIPSLSSRLSIDLADYTIMSASESVVSLPKEELTNRYLQLVYTSAAYSRHLTEDELAEILHASRKNNAHHGITGLLLYRDGSFTQFIKGPPRAVDKVFQKIQKDPRHRCIARVLRKYVDKRDFSQWDMAFRRLDINFDVTQIVSDRYHFRNDFSQILNVGLKVGDHTDCDFRPDAFGNAKLDLPSDMSTDMRKLITTFYRLLDRPL